MFGAVIITFVITTLAIFVLLLRDNEKKQHVERERLRRSNESLNSRIAEMIRQENSRRETDAYNRGLYDGRTTDTLYRKMLTKYSSGEQATVMMYGEEESIRRK